jgi:hypothetical protein
MIAISQFDYLPEAQNPNGLRWKPQLHCWIDLIRQLEWDVE